MPGIVLTDADLENARSLYNGQLVSPLTDEGMFSAAIYCLLSVAERYDKHTAVYESLVHNGLDQPREIINRPEDLRAIVRVTRFPNQKEDRIKRLARWWTGDGKSFPRDVIYDASNGRSREFELRNTMAEEAPGIAYKAASLFMSQCGYENVVPVDIWMIRALRDLGHDVVVPDYKRNSGPLKKEYLRLEKILSEIATDDYGLSPTIFQSALWAKYSAWNTKNRL
ncbi:MAG: hypothetical protein NT016_02455 [Candidatus Aenigmarchaeota archaeon]|nr:hypothetical protein [Candidatus Aenigmarchaeota archaeon]